MNNKTTFIKRKSILALIMLVLICAVSFSCSKKNNEEEYDALKELPEPEATPTATPVPTATPIPTPTPEPTPTPDLHIGEVRSPLTGYWIKEEVAKQRPWAFSLNNIIYANPQSGIGEASIVYEALTEGGITRFLGIFEGMDENFACAERIGSVRSARHYFASVAWEYDSIFIHFGRAIYALDTFANLKMDHLDCMEGVGDGAYYRDKEVKAPHNAFCTYERVKTALEKGKYRLEHKEGFTDNHFDFYDEATYPASGNKVFDQKGEAIVYSDPVVRDASKVSLYYRSDFIPYFTYDEATHLYTRYQYKDVHIDYNTKQPVTFTNIIIQIVNEWTKDKKGYQDMDQADATGNGYYISMGQCVPITWKKVEATNFMSYYDAQGNVLHINPGKTFISLFPNYYENKLGIE